MVPTQNKLHCACHYSVSERVKPTKKKQVGVFKGSKPQRMKLCVVFVAKTGQFSVSFDAFMDGVDRGKMKRIITRHSFNHRV